MKKLSIGLKTVYGLGFASRGIKDGLFQLFLFFYFSQVLGLDASLAGTSSLIALIFDAVSDPMVGLISDKWQSKNWGRRQPFMFWSALPLGFFTWVLFSPPAGLSQMALFWWLTGFGIMVRFALTFFVVPYISLGAELSTDYKERGLLLTWIAFPKQTDIADVPPEAIEWLGIIGGPILLVFFSFALIFLFYYPITKVRYEEIRASLDAK